MHCYGPTVSDTFLISFTGSRPQGSTFEYTLSNILGYTEQLEAPVKLVRDIIVQWLLRPERMYHRVVD